MPRDHIDVCILTHDPVSCLSVVIVWGSMSESFCCVAAVLLKMSVFSLGGLIVCGYVCTEMM